MNAPNPVLEAKTIADIDIDDPWFMADSTDRFRLPGTKLAAGTEAKPNVVARKQSRLVIMDMREEPVLQAMPPAEAFDHYRVNIAKLRGDQYDIQLADVASNRMSARTAHLTLTPEQERVVTLNLGALRKPADRRPDQRHFDSSVQAEMDKLDDETRSYYAGALRRCETRGQLNSILNKLSAEVGDPARNRAMAKKTIADEVADLDIDEDENPFGEGDDDESTDES